MIAKFWIETKDVKQQDVVSLGGIVNVGEVKLGTCFTRIISKGKADLVVADVSDQGDRPIALRVSKIVAYQHELDVLPRGMTGEIHVSGAGVELLDPLNIIIAEEKGPGVSSAIRCGRRGAPAALGGDTRRGD